jgi:hypothetical protein
MSDTDTLEHQVAGALRVKAAELHIDAAPFVPSRAVGALEPAPARRRRRAWMATAAAAAACVAVVVWAAVPSGHHDQVSTAPSTATTSPTASGHGQAPDPVLGQAPAWVPAGLRLQVVGAVRLSEATPLPAQLFGATNRRPELFVQLQPGMGSLPTGGQATVVRGLPATAQPAKDFSSTTTTLIWNEGVTVEASFHDMRLSEAEGLLATLVWSQPADHLAGFRPGPGSSLVLLGQTSEASLRSATEVDLSYGDRVTSQAPGEGRQLTVRTTTGGGNGDPSEAYLQAWFHGVRQPEGPAVSFDPTFGTLSIGWPDGRTAWIDANHTALTRAELEHVAAGLRPLDRAGYEQLEARAAATVRSQLPLAASARTREGLVELRANSSLAVVCLQAADRTWACSLLTITQSTTVVLSLLRADTWLVVVAARTPITVDVFDGLRPGRSLPLTTVAANGWNLGVLAPPSSVHGVVVNAGHQGQGASRPAA